MNLSIITLLLLSSKLPAKTTYPVPPKTKTHLFYIQRNINTNTIVYEANFDKNGQLVKEQPIKIFWLLYENNSEKEPLTRLENTFAYGLKHQQCKDIPNEYDIQLVSYKNLKLKLRQSDPFKAEIFIQDGSMFSKLDHVFVNANNNGIWSRVKHLEIFTINNTTHRLGKKTIFLN